MKKLLLMILSGSMVSVFAAEVQNQVVKEHILHLADSAHPMYRYVSDPSQDSYRLNNLIKNNPSFYLSDPIFANALLIKATEQYLASIIELLVTAGIDLDATGKDGKTALMVAAHNGNGEAINLLIAHGANPYIQNKKDGFKTAGEYAQDDIKKVFEKALNAQRAEKNIYEAQKPLVKTELKAYFPNDLTKMVEEYTYSDDYDDYLELIQNTPKPSRKPKESKEKCSIQ